MREISVRRRTRRGKPNRRNGDKSCKSCSARAATPCGRSRLSFAITALTSKLGERVFFNFNCVVLDVCQVHIGSFTLFCPAVQIYTPMHPFNAEQCGTTERGVRQGGGGWKRR